MTDPEPSVRFECSACGWVEVVARDRIEFLAGFPHADHLPEHDCPTGAPDVVEKSSWLVNMRCTKPGYNYVLKL